MDVSRQGALRALAALVALAALASGCSDDPPPAGIGQAQLDAGPQGDAEAVEPDAAQGVDADTVDAGADDADPEDADPGDAGPADASADDAGADDVNIDEGMDAEAPDAPEALDADEVEVGEEVGPPTIGELCFSEILSEGEDGPEYDQFGVQPGSHCQGTNHQDIVGVERVVFFGDSVTQGTPNDLHPLCIENEHFYRNRLADWLVGQFGLDIGDLFQWGQWRTYSCLYNGEPGRVHAGDFSNCSKWGGRTDDLLGDANCAGHPDEETRARCCSACCAGGACDDRGRCVRAANAPVDDALCGASDRQIFQCLPQGGLDQPTLFIFTLGGNDIAAITKDGAEITSETPEGRAEIDAGYPTIWALAERTVAYLEQAVAFLKDPARFPAGSFVVFANPFEFTDGTGDVGACSPDSINIPGIGPLDVSALGLNLAEIAGFGQWERPEVQRDIVLWITEQFMRIAVDYQADMIWMLEHFCGHGYVATGLDADTENRCYRESDPTLWFDITCTHPNPTGHRAIFEMFRDTIRE